MFIVHAMYLFNIYKGFVAMESPNILPVPYICIEIVTIYYVRYFQNCRIFSKSI